MCVNIVHTVEVAQHVKFTCTRSHFSGSLDKNGRNYGLQPEIPRGEISHSEITKYSYDKLRHVWELYFKSDLL